jgi:hypothetical protein
MTRSHVEDLARESCQLNDVVVEDDGCPPGDPLRVSDLGFHCREVGTTADRLGSMLAAKHEGRLAFSRVGDPEHRCED